MSNEILVVLIFISFGYGLFYGLKTREKPEKFWTYLVCGLLFTSPLMIGGYTWYDEIYAIGYMISNVKNATQAKKNYDFYFTIIFILFMIIASLRGIAFFIEIDLVAGLSKIRWLGFYILLFVIFLKIAPRKNIVYNSIDTAYSITKAGFLFTIFYTIIGIFAVYTSGSVAYTQYAQIDSSGASRIFALFGATAYVATQFLVIIPAALFVIINGDYKKVKLSITVLCLVFANQLFFGSRSGMLLFIVFVSLFLSQNHKFKISFKSLFFFFSLIIILGVFQLFFNEQNISIIYEDMLNTLHLSDGESLDLQDIDRKVWNMASISALLDNLDKIFYGWGLRTSGYIISSYVYELFLESRGFAILEEDVATPGFAALVIDAGLTSIILISIMVFYTSRSILNKNKNTLIFLSFAPVSFALQLFVMNITDVLLFWLAIMPGGIYCSFFQRNSS